jgi:hypothetical protein
MGISAGNAEPAQGGTAEKRPWVVGTAVGLVLCVFWVFDWLVMNVPLFGCLAAGLLALVVLVLGLLRRKSRKPMARLLMALSLASILSIGLTAITVRFNWHMGQKNAERIVEAVRAFQKDHGNAYPESLEALVPEYLDRVPHSRIGIMWSYRYWIDNDRASLMWIQIPPFGRQGYDFAEDRWWTLD